jgi:hypothetical protein
MASPLPAKAQAALGLSSTPNLGVMLKISQVLCLVDDFMFYVYINMTYGREFEKFLYFMWNISMERWVPSSLSSFYYDIQDKYDRSVEMKNITLLPKLWT